MIPSRVRLRVPPALTAQPPFAWIALAFIGGYTWFLSWAMETHSYDFWGSLVFPPLLIAVSVPVIMLVTKNDRERRLPLLIVALIAKLLSSFPREFVNQRLYDGLADANRYDQVGKEIAKAYSDGILSPSMVIPTKQGTAFIEQLTGFVYILGGPTKLGGFIIFSWMGFWGLFLFYRAALLALPDLDHARFAKYLFFLPSLLFWPSSIGKEAWMLMCLGIASYGTARVMQSLPLGFITFSIGTVGLFWVRPHVAILAMASLGVALLARRSDSDLPMFGTGMKIVVTVVLLVGMSWGLTRMNAILGLNTQDDGGITAALDATQRRTSVGASAVETERPNSVIDYPQALFSVLFRPTLIEVRKPTQLVSAAETTFMLFFCFQSRKRLRRAFALMAKQAYVLYSLVFSALFIFAWSNVGNLGILARQRIQVLPFLLVLLCMKPAERDHTRPTAHRDRTELASSVWRPRV